MKEHTVRVAYADDHVSVRKGIILFLENLGGISVELQANNGQELIALLERAKEFPDVILLDISMPVMDGFETITVIKQYWPEAKVIALTMHPSEFFVTRMIEKGANGYLLKTCDPAEIKHALMVVNQSGYYYSDVVTSRFFNQVKNGTIRLPHLTENETKFLKLCPTLLTYSQIAQEMNVTLKAVEGYRDRLSEKLNLEGKNNRIGLAMFALQFGLFNIGEYDSMIVSTTRNDHGRY